MARSGRSIVWPWVGRSALYRRLMGLSALALLTISPTVARAQSLETTLATVYQTNPVLEAERAKLRATDEKLPQALSNWRPTVAVTLQKGLADYDTSGNLQTVSADDAKQFFGLAVSQPVYRGGQTQAEKAQALNLIRAERAQLVVTEQAVLYAATSDYINVALALDLLSLNKDHVTLARKELETTRGRLSAGELTQTDVDQAEAAYAKAIAECQVAQDVLNTESASFFHDVGFQPGTDLTLPDAAPLLPATREDAITLAERNNPGVVAARFAVDAQQDDIRLIRGKLLPTLSLNGQIYSEQLPLHNGGEVDNREIVAQLSVPLYDGGKVYSESREAQQTVSQLQSVLDEAQQNAVLVANSAWYDWEGERASTVALKDEIDADQKSVEGVISEQSVGARTELDVLNAKEALFQAQLAAAKARHDELSAEFLLETAVGQMTVGNLGIRVTPYDPDINLETVRNKWWGFKTGQQPRSATPPSTVLPDGGYYELGDSGVNSVTSGTINRSAPQTYIQAQAAAVQPPETTTVNAMSNTTDNPATAAALADFDHDLSPAPPANKWMDQSSP